MQKFYIEMLKAEEGDSYIINIEDEDRKIRILVDGGAENRENFKENIINSIFSVKGECMVDIVIVTHIDNDHIGGILDLLESSEVKDNLQKELFIIFNDLVDEATISYKQGIKLKEQVNQNKKIKLMNTYKRNNELKINGFKIYFESNLGIKSKKDKDDVMIKFLLPQKEILKKLMKNWRNNKKNSMLVNRTSIVFTLEYMGKIILMTGDALFSDIEKVLKEIEKLDIIKIAHHGTKKNNVGLMEIIAKTKCEKLMLLTNNEKCNCSEELLKDIKGANAEIYCPYSIEKFGVRENNKIFIIGEQNEYEKCN